MAKKQLILQDINMTPIEPRQRWVVAVDTCFAIYVARQKGVTTN